MERNSSQEKRNYSNGSTLGSLTHANSHTTIHPSLQGYVRSSTISRVTPKSTSKPHLASGGSLSRNLKSENARSSLEVNKVRQESQTASRVPIRPVRTLDDDGKDILYPLREHVHTFTPKPSILKSPGTKSSLEKKTVSVNTGQSTIVHVRDSVNPKYSPEISPAQSSDLDSVDGDSNSQSSQTKFYSTVIPLNDTYRIAWDGQDPADNDSILSRGTSNGSVLSYDTQWDDTASSYLSYQPVGSDASSNNAGSNTLKPMVSSIFLPPKRNSTEPNNTLGRHGTRSPREESKSKVVNTLGELSSSTYRSHDGVFTIAISETDDSSVLTTSERTRTATPEERGRVPKGRISFNEDMDVRTYSVNPHRTVQQHSSGERDRLRPLLKPSRGVMTSSAGQKGIMKSPPTRGIMKSPNARQPGLISQARGMGRRILTSKSHPAVSPTTEVFQKTVHRPIHNKGRVDMPAAPPRYRVLPITIQHDSPSEYSEYSEHSEYSDAESVWSSSSVASGHSEYRTSSSTPSASYYSNESQYSSTPSASHYSSDDRNSSRTSYETAASDITVDLSDHISRVRIG